MLSRTGVGLGLMARAPAVGRVKTRLAETLGADCALAIYRELLSRVEREIVTPVLEHSGSNVAAYWFVQPPQSIPRASEEFTQFKAFFGQTDGNLGAKMSAALGNLLAGHEKGILFGADIPDLTLKHVLDAAATLDSCDVVFGPTRDGGYSLIGMKEMHTELFEGITWSSSKTLAESLAVCRRLGYSYQMLEELADLDTFEDFSYITWRPRSVKLPGADAQ